MRRSVLTAVTLISITVFLGLAVLGWGSLQGFFSKKPLIALAVVSYFFSIVAVFSEGNISSGVREDKGNRWVISALMIVSVAVGYVPALTDRLDFWTIDGSLTRWVGVGAFFVGCALRIWPVFVLGNRFSGLVAIQQGHSLVTVGIYKTIRNPSYLGMLVTVLGWGLAFRSVIGVLFTIPIIVVLVYRMRSEETLLHSQFGEEYDSYRAHTWKLIPFIY